MVIGPGGAIDEGGNGFTVIDEFAEAEHPFGSI
jgi:hypothetical protein